MLNPVKTDQITQSHDIWKIVRKECRRSNLWFQHAAVLVRDNQILAIGTNHRNFMSLRDLGCHIGDYTTVHAEVDCLRKLDFEQKTISGAVMFLYGQNLLGKAAYSKPCQSCQGLLNLMRVSKVYYSTPDGIEEVITCRRRQRI